MRTFSSYLRILVIMTLIYIVTELLIDIDGYQTVLFHPYILLFFFCIFLIIVSFEVVINALETLTERVITPEKAAEIKERERLAKENHWLKRLWKYLFGLSQKPEESLLLEDHNYDGIKELNNPLPPWWIYLFYTTILFAGVYLVRYHIFDGVDQIQEYEISIHEAKLELEEYKKTAVDLVDASTVEVQTDSGNLSAGKAIFNTQCAVCHRTDGGGSIGPNLTDAFWILGGTIQSIYTTVSEGGRPGKGMIAWKSTLRPSEIQQVSSYIISLGGTNPENPKAPEGEEVK